MRQKMNQNTVQNGVRDQIKYKTLLPCQCRNGQVVVRVQDGKQSIATFKNSACLASVPENRRIDRTI